MNPIHSAPGENKITYRLIKNLSENHKEKFVRFYNNILIGTLPVSYSWKNFKKGKIQKFIIAIDSFHYFLL